MIWFARCCRSDWLLLLPRLCPRPLQLTRAHPRHHAHFYSRPSTIACFRGLKMGTGASKKGEPHSKGDRETTPSNPNQGEESQQREKVTAATATDHKPSQGKNEELMEEGEGEENSIQSDYVEAVVAMTTDIADGEMKEVSVGEEGQVLLIRQNGQFSAIGHKCTHYGAPLAKGCLGNGRVRCPWHGACFNSETGDIEEFPGLDSLARYDVTVKGEEVIVRAKKEVLHKGRRTGLEGVTLESTEDDRVFITVGGGPASVEAAVTLRREGFKGRIIIISREDVLPYDRPKLSKAMHSTPDTILLRSQQFYDDNKIELQLGKEVTSVDPASKTVTLQDGGSLSYSSLLLATGSKPRTLPIPGFDKEGVYLLREPSQANAIAQKAQGKKVVIIGTSFIGMEVGAYLVDKAASVDCIGIAAVPFERVLGERIGRSLLTMFEEKGVVFHLQSGVTEIMGEEGKVTGVLLPSGKSLPADLCVFGVGVVPATDFLLSSGLPMSGRKEMVVDEHMMVADSIYAAGDIAQFPLPLTGDRVSIGHWQIAHNHGHIAAINMIGKKKSFNSVPFFWTVLFGKSLRYCGFALTWDEIIYDGSPEELKFTAFFVKDEKVIAATSLNADPVVARAAELLYQNKMPTASELRSNPNLLSLQ